MTTSITINHLFNKAMAADDAYQTALVETYGKDAGDMRYASVLPSSIALLRVAKREADDAYFKAVRSTVGKITA